MTLNELIDAAVANRKQSPRADGSLVWSIYSSASMETPIGKVVCVVDHSHRNANSLKKHVHVNFDLNGKRIARAVLIEKLHCKA